MIITVAATLGLIRNIGSAMTAGGSHHTLGLVRCLGQRAMAAFARGTLATLGLAASAATPRTALAKVVLRGRDMRVLRGLARLADQRLQFRNPRSHPLDHLVLRKQQIVLLSFGQNMKRGWSHGQFKSSSRPPRKPFLPTP